MHLQTLNILGAGRVACTLARLWHGHGTLKVQAVCNRSLASAQEACAFIGSGAAFAEPQAMPSADLWLIGVPDAAIAATALQLVQQRVEASAAFHCSGALDSGLLDPLAQRGWATASAHCLLSFANREQALAQFVGTPCALEGDAALCERLHAALGAIGAQCFPLASADKVLYHAGAVLATNFLPVLQALAEDAWRATGVPAQVITRLRNSLPRNAVANIEALGPAGALTGPAARGDLAAIARQAAVVQQWDAQAGEAYQALSALALRLANNAKEASATNGSS